MKSKILVLARFAAAAVLSAAAMSSSYAATVEGTDANATLSPDGNGTVLDANATVGSGVEFTYNTNLDSYFTADLSDAGVTLISFTGATTGIGASPIWEFTLDPSLTISGVSEVSDTFINGVSLQFANNVVTFTIADQIHSPRQTFSAVYTWVLRSNNVPEPSSFALLGLGLAGLGLSRRRKTA